MHTTFGGRNINRLNRLNSCHPDDSLNRLIVFNLVDILNQQEVQIEQLPSGKVKLY